jgi:Uma2 family endonuclease
MMVREKRMGLAQRKGTHLTIDEILTWDGRWELIDGTVYDMTPAPSLEHQRVAGALHLGLSAALKKWKRGGKGGQDCEVFFAPVDLYLPSGLFQPDLVVVCDSVKKTSRGIEGAPDLVIEILSPGTAGKDLSRKRWAYEAAKVPEYLWVDPEERLGVLLRLDAQGHYQEASRVEWGSLVALLGEKISITLGAP